MMFPTEDQFKRSVRSLARWVAGVQVVLLYVLGFGLQYTTTTDTTGALASATNATLTTCVAEMETQEENSVHGYAGLLVAATLAFVFECIRAKQTVLAGSTKPASPCLARIFMFKESSAYNFSPFVIVLELGSCAAHVVTWVLVILLKTAVHDTIDNASNTVCAAAGVDLKVYADVNFAVAIGGAVIWLFSVIDYARTDSYDDTVEFKIMNVRAGQFLRLVGALGILIVSGLELGNNFHKDDMCSNTLVYPFTCIAVFGSIAIFFWSLYGCDTLVDDIKEDQEDQEKKRASPTSKSPLVDSKEDQEKKRVSPTSLSRVLAGTLLFTTLTYHLLTLKKTRTERSCPTTGWNDVDEKPYQAFVISLSLIIVEMAVNLLILNGFSGDFIGGKHRNEHGVHTRVVVGKDGQNVTEGQKIVGAGLRPSKDMQTLRLTHDGPDKKPSSLSFV